MKCTQCGAPFSWALGFIPHAEDCPGIEVDFEVFGVGGAFIDPD